MTDNSLISQSRGAAFSSWPKGPAIGAEPKRVTGGTFDSGRPHKAKTVFSKDARRHTIGYDDQGDYRSRHLWLADCFVCNPVGTVSAARLEDSHREIARRLREGSVRLWLSALAEGGRLRNQFRDSARLRLLFFVLLGLAGFPVAFSLCHSGFLYT